jgi:hypothetical protein
MCTLSAVDRRARTDGRVVAFPLACRWNRSTIQVIPPEFRRQLDGVPCVAMRSASLCVTFCADPVSIPVANEVGTTFMKTMTCKQLGGPCDLQLQGQTADDVIKAQDKHLNDAVASGDVAHESALKAMKGRWKHPWSGMKWYKSTKREFADLPDD